MQKLPEKIRVNNDTKLLRDSKRPCTAFIKSNIAGASSESNVKRNKKRTSYKDRSFGLGRPGTAPNYTQSRRHKKEVPVCKGEKNLLWRQKEEAARQRRAEIYAINRLLQLKFQADFEFFMKSSRS